MVATRPYSDIIERLRAAGLRPTRQRLALGRLLFDGADRHVTAEELHTAVTAKTVTGKTVTGKAGVSLATVYNTLHQFTRAGLLREVALGPGRSFFDTNISDHHHIFYEDDGRLEDIPAGAIEIARRPAAPAGCTVTRVDVVMRVSASKKSRDS
ncbi:MAG: Fur family transcriptional regulator [Alphaproteobacteria bacterium]|nr:Fur family transcriptional regulator [Alphaproteobacteria bacterium]MCZ6764463.1 Fur family transcriptional regulator [Alphaproteobacteria bacterium]